MFQNRSGHLALVDLWYDFEGGRNLNLIRSQQGRTLFDVEWNNGTRYEPGAPRHPQADQDPSSWLVLTWCWVCHSIAMGVGKT